MASAALADEENEFLEQIMPSMKFNVATCNMMKAWVFYFNNPQNITLGHKLGKLNSCIMNLIASYLYYCRPAERVEQTDTTEYHALSFSVRCCSSKYSSVYWNCF
jgi:hypothetical protein